MSRGRRLALVTAAVGTQIVVQEPADAVTLIET
jgi:hypothetical protein